MRVILKTDVGAWNTLMEVFLKAKNDGEDGEFYEIDASELEYAADHGSWRLAKDSKTVYLSFEGSRAVFTSLQPFDGCDWSYIEDDRAYLNIAAAQAIRFVVADYESSTPPEWALSPWDDVMILEKEPNKAVVMRGGTPRFVVPYKNVYGEKQ